MRRRLVWLVFGIGGAFILGVTALLLGVRFAPGPVISRLPPVLLPWVADCANSKGIALISERLHTPEAQATVIAALEGPPHRQRQMLDLLGQSGIWAKMPKNIADLVQPLTGSSDPDLRAPARWLYGSVVDLGLAWNQRRVKAADDLSARVAPGPGSWKPDHAAAQGLVLLAYLGAGYDHRMPSKYKNTAKLLVTALVATQDGQGRFASSPSDHAIITCALAEAYAMSGDPELKQPTQRGIDWICRTEDGGAESRWSADSESALWSLCALKSADAGGLRADLRRLDAWRLADADIGRRWFENGVEVPVQSKDLFAQRALFATFFADKASTHGLNDEDLAPDASLSPCTNHRLSIAAFALGSDRNRLLRPYHHALINRQVWDGGDDHGCLDPDRGAAQQALQILSIEVRYRYVPIKP